MSQCGFVRELDWTFSPQQAMASWQDDIPLIALVSGGNSPAFDQWTILAPRLEVKSLTARTSCAAELLDLIQTFAPLRAAQFVDSGRLRLPFVGGWIGFVGYGCAPLFEPLAQVIGGAHDRHACDTAWPDAMLCRVPRALVYSHALARWFDVGDSSAPNVCEMVNLESIHDLRIHSSQRTRNSWAALEGGLITPHANAGNFENMVTRTVEYVRAGDIFQANITQPFRAGISGSVRSFALDALANTSPRYGAYLELDNDRALLSFSPELFLSLDGESRRVTTRPMKGTRSSPSDAVELLASAKDAAELHMIVDLMRNDLGRICDIGSIRVDEARMIEHHPTVLQAVSEISGKLSLPHHLADLFSACFPPGSVTGAPKIRAMQIIDELESTARGPYCGAIGLASSCGSALFSVAIRTAQLSRSLTPNQWTIEYHAGCGIVADSDPASEAQECLAKVEILRVALANPVSSHQQNLAHV
ncbi:MAG: anthranilate synthase component I family protein [Planctomycetota bacterium]|nr:anthranilate synthase component I family protein [Planctomycetota bacterium]